MTVRLKDSIFVILQGLLMISWLLEVEDLSVRLPENLRWLAMLLAVFGGILLLVSLLQLGSRLSPFPSPKENTDLVTSGAFAFCRHPIYSGLLFGAFGMAVWMDSGYKLLISLLLLLFFYLKSAYEERQLQQRFPEYSSYKRETGRFFPKFNWRI